MVVGWGVGVFVSSFLFIICYCLFLLFSSLNLFLSVSYSSVSYIVILPSFTFPAGRLFGAVTTAHKPINNRGLILVIYRYNIYKTENKRVGRGGLECSFKHEGLRLCD